MNPVLLFTVANSSKRQLYFVLAVLAIIMLLPILEVFSFGAGALAFLSDNNNSDDTAAVSITTQGLYEGPEISGDTYAWGNCTYWAYALRLKADDPIPNTWGNANTWDDRAKGDGYLVDHSPAPGAIYQTDNGDLGHVAYISEVDPVTGSWTISEMNSVGLDIVDLKTFPAASAQYYNFIHDKVH